MTKILMIVGIGILGYIGASYYQTGRMPSWDGILQGGGGGAFAGGYGAAVDGARSVGGAIGGLASGVSGNLGQ